MEKRTNGIYRSHFGSSHLCQAICVVFARVLVPWSRSSLAPRLLIFRPPPFQLARPGVVVFGWEVLTRIHLQAVSCHQCVIFISACKMSWKNKRNGMPSGLAAELLRSLFSGDGGPRHQPRPQWKCPGCHTQNYMNRSTCRYCGANSATTPTTPPTKKNQSPVNAKPLALAPWATLEMVKQREEQVFSLQTSE